LEKHFIKAFAVG